MTTKNGSIHMTDIEKISEALFEDFHLSRYACYLIAMNGDPRKRAVALATPDKSIRQLERA